MTSLENQGKSSPNNSPTAIRKGTSRQGSGPQNLKKVQQDITVAKNRLALLRQQLQKQKDAIKKNKILTQQTLAKKIAVNSINSYKLKDNSEDIARVQMLKRRNHSVRLQHEKSLQNIQKAIYLVKLDDAREVKNISEEHRRRIREMQNDQQNKRFQKKKKLKQQSERAKQRYMKYWKQKLSNIYAEQALSAQQIERNKQQKQRELKYLEQQEIRLLEQINNVHSKNVETKKQYVAALSLPVKQVALAMANSTTSQGHGHETKKMGQHSRSKSLADMDPKNRNPNKIMHTQTYQNPSLPALNTKIKVPHTTNVNEVKLKIILNQLKRIQKNKLKVQQENTTFNNSGS